MNEMALPAIDSAEKAALEINKFAPIINKGEYKGGADVKGILEAALQAISKSTNPEKYEREIKMAKIALKKVNAYNMSKNTHSMPSKVV